MREVSELKMLVLLFVLGFLRVVEDAVVEEPGAGANPVAVWGGDAVVDDGEVELETSCTRSRASLSSASVYSSNGSRLERMVPENKTGSCGMIARRLRRSRSLIFETSIPSM